jgi:hypothetical protein
VKGKRKIKHKPQLSSTYRTYLQLLQNFLHRPEFALMNMGVVKNSVNNTICKKVRLIDAHLNYVGTHKTLAGECNRKVSFSRRQQPEMFANAEHDAPETFCDTKLVPLRQHHLHFRNKVPTISIISLLV